MQLNSKIDIWGQRRVLMEKTTNKSQAQLFLLELFDGCIIRQYEKYPDRKMFIKNGTFTFYEEIGRRIHLKADVAWWPLTQKFKMPNMPKAILTDQQIHYMLKEILLKHFGLDYDEFEMRSTGAFYELDEYIYGQERMRNWVESGRAQELIEELKYRNPQLIQ